MEELYQLFAKDIYYYLLHLTHHEALAEDLLSITFTRAITSFRLFRKQSSEKTWLIGIARNAYFETIRQEDRDKERIRQYIDAKRDSDARLLDRIEQLMKQRDDRSQAVFQLRLKGVSYQEIAKQLTISDNSARVIDFRNREWLKQQIRQEDEQ